jgi:hypothetical protein
MRMLPEHVAQQDKTLALSLEVPVAESRGRRTWWFRQQFPMLCG